MRLFRSALCIAAPILPAGLPAVLPTAAPTALAAASDTVAPGYRIDSEFLVSPDASFATLPHGGILLFDGHDVSARFPPGKWAAYVGSVPAFVYPSFVLPHPTQAYALIGESSHGQILEIDFVSGALVPIAQIPLNFAAVWEDSAHLLVSAAPCMLICGNQILRVDASNGAQSLVAQVPGSSGPLAMSAGGDLYYGLQATTYPPPPHSMSVLRWAAAQLGGSAVLSEVDAEVLVSGLDGLASIEVDPVRKHLWVAESRWPGGSEVREYALDGSPLGTVVASPNWIANLEITPLHSGRASGRVHRYGAPFVLRYASIDYNSPGRAEIVTVLADAVTVPPAHR